MNIEELKSKCQGISLGMFAADLGDLRSAAVDVTEWGCNILHFDIMDGVFVPAMIGGPAMVAALDTAALRDVHLMIENPADHVASYVKAGADIIVVHGESNDAGKAIENIRAAAKEAGRPVLAGLGLMPGTDLADVADLLGMKPDMILVLSLDPRTKNPPDITQACARLNELRQMAPDAVLAFDGGVTQNSINEIAAANPDMVVSGSAVLGAKNPKMAYAEMLAALN